MGNAQHDRSRARTRLALIAPIPTGLTLMDLEHQSADILREADHADSDELLSEALDAVARKYFAHGIHRAHQEADNSIPSPLARPSCLHCGIVMSLILIEPDQDGFDLRTFKCPTCNGAEKIIIQYKPDHA